MNNATAVRQLGQSLGLSLELTEGEACELIIGEDLSVLISGEPSGSRLRLAGVVASFPDGDRGSIATTLLKANYNGQGTGAAAIALDPISEDVILTRTVNASEAGLTAAVEEFANYLDFWRNMLDAIATGGHSRSEADAPASMGSMRV